MSSPTCFFFPRNATETDGIREHCCIDEEGALSPEELRLHIATILCPLG